jgi:small subunit ribosomal protein S20
MPNLKSSIKDLRKSRRKATYNDRIKNRVKKSIKKFQTLLLEGKKKEAEKTLENTYKILDKAAKKNIIKKGKASRKKSRLTIQLNKLAQSNVKDTKKST